MTGRPYPVYNSSIHVRISMVRPGTTDWVARRLGGPRALWHNAERVIRSV
jgi:hypothetical protein